MVGNRIVGVVGVLMILASGAISAYAQSAKPGESDAVRPEDVVDEVLVYDPIGLSLTTPYVRGKIPAVFIHGLWMNPWS